MKVGDWIRDSNCVCVDELLKAAAVITFMLCGVVVSSCGCLQMQDAGLMKSTSGGSAVAENSKKEQFETKNSCRGCVAYTIHNCCGCLITSDKMSDPHTVRDVAERPEWDTVTRRSFNSHQS